MPMLSHPAFGPKLAIIYITAGALIDVWTAVYYFAKVRGREGGLNDTTQFWLLGFFLTGLTLLVVGLLLGRIGRSARKAELPPSEAMNAEATIQATAAAHPNVGLGTPAVGGQAMAGMAPGQMPMNAAPPAQAGFVPGVTRQ